MILEFIILLNYLFWLFLWVSEEECSFFCGVLVLGTIWPYIFLLKPKWWYEPYSEAFDNNWFVVNLIRN
jgi:hypothetical protein